MDGAEEVEAPDLPLGPPDEEGGELPFFPTPRRPFIELQMSVESVG